MVAFLLAGCFAGQQITQIDAGMSHEQVIGILGAADAYRSAGDTEAMTHHSNRLMPGWSWGILPTITWCSPMGGCQPMAPGVVRQNYQNVLDIVPLRWPLMTSVVSTTYRYKRPPKKRKAVASMCPWSCGKRGRADAAVPPDRVENSTPANKMTASRRSSPRAVEAAEANACGGAGGAGLTTPRGRRRDARMARAGKMEPRATPMTARPVPDGRRDEQDAHAPHWRRHEHWPATSGYRGTGRAVRRVPAAFPSLFPCASSATAAAKCR